MFKYVLFLFCVNLLNLLSLYPIFYINNHIILTINQPFAFQYWQSNLKMAKTKKRYKSLEKVREKKKVIEKSAKTQGNKGH